VFRGDPNDLVADTVFDVVRRCHLPWDWVQLVCFVPVHQDPGLSVGLMGFAPPARLNLSMFSFVMSTFHPVCALRATRSLAATHPRHTHTQTDTCSSQHGKRTHRKSSDGMDFGWNGHKRGALACMRCCCCRKATPQSPQIAHVFTNQDVIPQQVVMCRSRLVFWVVHRLATHTHTRTRHQ